MRLIYCCHPTTTQEPAWIEPLKNMLDSEWVLYRPWLGFQEQLQDPRLTTALSADAAEFFAANHTLLRLSPPLLNPFAEVLPSLLGFERSDAHMLMPYRDLYAFIRCHVMLVDLSTPSYGEVGHDVGLAHMARIPMIGISDRFINSPAIVPKLEALVPSFDVSKIAKQLRILGSPNGPGPGT